ncbi:MAG: PH domain-containing protein, partial [Candidatus Micrarchaeota archaeon]|nr:PH domain-containing protein [Candidatus Micrarchaeota archaeon]
IKNALIVLTNKRVLLIQLDMMNNPDIFEAYPRQQLKAKSFKKNLLSESLVIEFQDQKERKFNFPKVRLNEMKEFPEQLAAALGAANT